MSKELYQKWLTHWFHKKLNLPENALQCDFFEQGWLDSFGTIELVTAIEKELNLPLPDTALTDPRFSTILGLSEILFEQKEVKLC